MLPSEHDYLENTIASMRAAFEHGADVVEFDVHPTADGRFAVFHDRFLECRTNGQGITREQTMEQLKSLDIGYGYTSDGGMTYPFRGKAVGLMPAMDEVFETFPDRSFLIDVKGGARGDGELLASQLSRLTPDRRARLMVFGRDTVLGELRPKLPDLRMFSASSTAGCLLRYIATGWTGVVPASCHNSPVWVPVNVAPWLWGWPGRFMNRFEAEGSFVILMGAYPANEISPGLDTREDLARIPVGFNGGVWTNNVEMYSVFKNALRLQTPRRSPTQQDHP